MFDVQCPIFIVQYLMFTGKFSIFNVHELVLNVQNSMNNVLSGKCEDQYSMFKCNI